VSGAGMEQSLTQESSRQAHLVLFRLGEQNFALPVEDVYQIIEMVSIIRLPQVETLIEGVINVRGKMAPVVDLRRVLKKGTPSRGLNTPLILVKAKNQLTGIIVDEVLNVIEVLSERIARLDEFMPVEAARTPILQGIANPADDCVMVLDLDHLFEPGQGEALSQMAESLVEIIQQTSTPEEPAEAGLPSMEEAVTGLSEAPVEPEKPDNLVNGELAGETRPNVRRKASRSKRAKAMQGEVVLKVLRETMEAGE